MTESPELARHIFPEVVKMTLNNLEQAALVRFFESEGFGKVNRDVSQIKIVDRHLTGKGFIAQLLPNEVIVLNGPSSFTGGIVGAKVNGNIDIGFLFFIKDGYVDAIEGFTYGEEWPDEIKTVEVYLIPDQKKN